MFCLFPKKFTCPPKKPISLETDLQVAEIQSPASTPNSSSHCCFQSRHLLCIRIGGLPEDLAWEAGPPAHEAAWCCNRSKNTNIGWAGVRMAVL